MTTGPQAVTIDPAVWLEPVRGGFPDPGLFGLSGVEQIRAYLDGYVPPPPLHHLTGVLPTAAERDSVTFVMPATSWLLSPPGHISLGALAVLADASLGCTVQVGLPPATPYTTSDLSLAFIRPVPTDGRTLSAPGRSIHLGRSLGMADALIEDADGRAVAHSTTRCFILPPIDPPPDPPDRLEPVSIPEQPTPDPYQRPVSGQAVPQDVWDRMSGLEVMRALSSGDLAAPPIVHLTGLRPVSFDEGSATFSLPCTAWLCSPSGYVQGGMIALLADTVLASAVQTTVGPRTVYAPLDLKVNFLRPVLPDGRDLQARATVVHRGRSMAVSRADVTNADGKAVAMATGTALIREGHPWRPEAPSPPKGDRSG